MKLESSQRIDRDERVYTLTISGGDVQMARLNALDRLLLADCQTDDATIADSLLVLEMLARRIEQASGPGSPVVDPPAP